MITDEDGEDYDDDGLTREQKKINGMAATVTWEITFFLEFKHWAAFNDSMAMVMTIIQISIIIKKYGDNYGDDFQNVKTGDQRKPLIKVEVESEIEFHSGKKTPKHYFETKKINFSVSFQLYMRENCSQLHQSKQLCSGREGE